MHEWRASAEGCLQAHYTTLLRLKQYFPFSLIDAMGSLEECRAQIARELRYQSSLDLDEATYAAIRHLPLAKDLVRASRQQLVAHLDGYAKRHNALFERVGHWQPCAMLASAQIGGCDTFATSLCAAQQLYSQLEGGRAEG